MNDDKSTGISPQETTPEVKNDISEPSVLDWLRENVSSPRRILEVLVESLSPPPAEAEPHPAPQGDEPSRKEMTPIGETTSEATSSRPEADVAADSEETPDGSIAAERQALSENGGGELADSVAKVSSIEERIGSPEPGSGEDLRMRIPPQRDPQEGEPSRKAEVQFSIRVPVGMRVHLTVDALEGSDGEPLVDVSGEASDGEPVELKVLSAQASAAAERAKTPAPKKPAPFASLADRIRLPALPLGEIWGRASGLLETRGTAVPLGTVLFAMGGIVYLLTRLIALDRFPIYFFADEAYQVVFAQRLIENHFWSANQFGIPVYIEAAGLRWTPMISTYFHAISILLAGKSIIVARATSVFVSLIGVVAAGLTLKKVFKLRYWWVVVIFLAAAPAWFLHTRTAFETVMTSAFYATFLYFYLRYRTEEPKFVYPALIFGALTFYSYSIGQPIMGVAALMLFFSDLRYHWENRRTLARGLPILVLLAVPFIIFRIKEPGAIGTHLRAVDSYLLQDGSLPSKAVQFLGHYLQGLSPLYWFLPNSKDLIRHRMVGFGHLPVWSFPLAIIGLVITGSRIRESKYRTLILSMLAVPFGAALLDVTITRVLAFIIPASILISIGADWALAQAERWVSQMTVASGSFALLAVLSVLMMRTALVKGPFWSDDYGLYGLQYGAKQIFAEAIPQIWEQQPDAHFLVSSTWANGTNQFLDFFYDGERRGQVEISGIESYLMDKLDISQNDVFVLTPPEYQQVLDSQKLRVEDLERIVDYPDGNPGFYFTRLEYVDNIDQILEAERLERQKPLEGEVEIDGQQVKVVYSRNDMGQLGDMFDGDFYTLMRGMEANPYTLDFTFPDPRPLTGLSGDFGKMDFTITVELYAPGVGEPVRYELTERDVTTDPHIEMSFDRGPEPVDRMTVSIQNLLAGDTANIHIRELEFLP
jgi:hypothetical protein